MQIDKTRLASAFVVNRVKICLASCLITQQNDVCHTLCAHEGGPKILKDAAAPRLGTGGWLKP